MNVLVTGGAGFIGSNLTHYLMRERPSWKVTVADLLTYAGNLENISGLVESRKANFEKVDICDDKKMESLFKKGKFDLVFHLAAESHVDRSIHGAADFVRTNVLGTQHLLDLARKYGCQRFVHISTDEVYGSLGPTGRFTEETPLDPTSPYAASKAASDLMALACAKTHEMPVIVTRCTNNYGPYQFPEKLIPLFITNALESKKLPLYGDGMNVRSWLHVEDHCEALLLVADKGKSGEVYNIGGAEEAELPNRKVTETILSHLGRPTSLIEYVGDRPAHDRRYAIDYAKIERDLGWKPKTPFEKGIKDTIDWYTSNRNWWEKIKTGAYLDYYEKNYANRGSAASGVG